jgi:hypothetical protein
LGWRHDKRGRFNRTGSSRRLFRDDCWSEWNSQYGDGGIAPLERHHHRVGVLDPVERGR